MKAKWTTQKYSICHNYCVYFLGKEEGAVGGKEEKTSMNTTNGHQTTKLNILQSLREYRRREFKPNHKVHQDKMDNGESYNLEFCLKENRGENSPVYSMWMYFLSLSVYFDVEILQLLEATFLFDW